MLFSRAGKFLTSRILVLIGLLQLGCASSKDVYDTSDSSGKCLLQLDVVMSCMEKGFTSVPTFDESLHFRELLLSENRIAHLKNESFRNLHFLKSLNLNGNFIDRIDEGFFSALSQLNALFLDYNKITTLRAGGFRGLVYLQNLFCRGNRIDYVEPGTFDDVKKLQVLDLTKNSLTALSPGTFRGLSSLESLFLRSNNITHLVPGIFEDLMNLQRLELNANKITVLNAGSFRGLSSLTVLDLTLNSVNLIDPGTFEGLKHLNKLILAFNKLTVLHAGSFRRLPFPEKFTSELPNGSSVDFLEHTEIDLRFNKIERIHLSASPGFNRNVTFQTHDWRVCCIMPAYEVDCKAIAVGFTALQRDMLRDAKRTAPVGGKIPPSSVCENLMPSVIMRTVAWILGTFSVGFNAVILFWSLLSRCRNRGKVFSEAHLKETLLALCLAFGGFCMGIFLLIIVGADNHYRGYYILQEGNWRNSWLCLCAGFLSTFSLEFSVFILALFTLDSYVGIFSETTDRSMSYFSTKVIIICLVIISSLLAAIPLMNPNLENFYNKTSLCVALPFSIATTKESNLTAAEDDHLNWTYSFTIFIGLSSLYVASVFICCVRIFSEGVKTRRGKGTNRESRMELQLLLIVGTDVACWVPTIILGFVSAYGHQLPPTVYAWVAVVVLPFKSALTPTIYAFCTEAFTNAVSKTWSQLKKAFSTMFPCLARLISGNQRNETNETMEMDQL